MTNTKKTDSTHFHKHQEPNPLTPESQASKQTPDNLMLLNSVSSARDLNTRLHEMETELHELSLHLDSSHQSLQQTLIQKNLETHSEVKDSQFKIDTLEHSYQELGNKSESLAKETARLTLLLSESSQKHSDSVSLLEENSLEKFNLLSKQIEFLDEQVLKLAFDYNALKNESESLINEVSLQTNNLAESFSEHQGDFKKLAQDIETRNKNMDSKLEQVGRNFSFHDAKILKLHEKDTELDLKNNSLKELLKQTESEQKQSLTSLESDLKTEISSVSDESAQKYQSLMDEHTNLENRTSQVELKAEQLDTDLQETEQNHKERLLEHDERLSTHNTNLHSHETRLEQLNSVDEALNLRAEELKKTTERLHKHSGALEKTTVSLRSQSQGLQKAVTQLDKQNEQLEDKTDQLGLQIATNAQSERQHYQTMTMAISIVAVVTVLALLYSFINQQSLWQSSMDNDVVIERRMNIELSEQSVQIDRVKKELEQNIAQAEQERSQLTKNIEDLKIQLKAEQKKANTIIKGELKEIDDNVQFLNTSVGPLKDYARNTGKKALHTAVWLAQQSGENFTIQLTSVDSKQKLYQYVEQHGYALQGELAWFTIHSKGKDYYILTFGNFKELVQARAALSQLPSFVTENSPGISRMKDIQTFIH